MLDPFRDRSKEYLGSGLNLALCATIGLDSSSVEISVECKGGEGGERDLTGGEAHFECREGLQFGIS